MSISKAGAVRVLPGGPTTTSLQRRRSVRNTRQNL